MTLSLRAATPSDCRLFHDYVNRPDSLAHKLVTKQPIPWEEHEAWFMRRLDDPDCRMWVLTGDTKPIGQLRMTRGAQGWEIDIYIVEQHRRRGWARAALEQAIAALRGEAEARPVIARVKPDNRASCRLFESAGFHLARRDADHVVYVI